MMPTCRHRGCTKTSEIELGVIHTYDDGELWDERVYLCKKHAKKIGRELLLEVFGGKE